MTANSSPAADVLIVGGGIIGCSIAWRLAQAGERVTVLDRAQPGAEASSAAAGMLAPVGEMLTPRDFADLCLASHGLYPDFVREIEESSGQNAGYRSDGTLLVATNESLEEELGDTPQADCGGLYPSAPHGRGSSRAQTRGYPLKFAEAYLCRATTGSITNA